MPKTEPAEKPKFNKFTWHKEIRRAQLPRIPYLIAMTFFDYADEDGQNAWPGNKLIAEENGIAERSVKRGAEMLRNSGWVFRTRRSNHAHTRTFADAYRLTYPKDHPKYFPVDRPEEGDVDNSEPGDKAMSPDNEEEGLDRVTNPNNRVTNGADRVTKLCPPNKSLHHILSPLPLNDADEERVSTVQPVVRTRGATAPASTSPNIHNPAAEAAEEFETWTDNIGNPGW